MSERQQAPARRYLATWGAEYRRIAAIVQAVAGLLIDMGDREQRPRETDTLVRHLKASQGALNGLRMLIEALQVPPACAALHSETLQSLDAYDGALDGLVEALQSEDATEVTEEAIALGQATQRIGQLGARAGRLADSWR